MQNMLQSCNSCKVVVEVVSYIFIVKLYCCAFEFQWIARRGSVGSLKLHAIYSYFLVRNVKFTHFVLSLFQLGLHSIIGMSIWNVVVDCCGSVQTVVIG